MVRVIEVVEELIEHDIDDLDPEMRDDDFARRLHLVLIKNDDDEAA